MDPATPGVSGGTRNVKENVKVPGTKKGDR